MSQAKIDKFKNWTIKHLSILFHNLISQVIITIILGFVGVYYIDSLMDLLFFDIKVWQLILAIIIILFGLYCYTIIIPVDNISFKKFGLMWEAKIQKNNLKKIYGPLCPNCNCDISHTFVLNPVRKLSCSKCGNDFRIGNDNDVNKLEKNVEQIIKTDLNGNKTLDLTFVLYSIDNVLLWVKNKGVFPIQNLKIAISIIIKGEKKDIWQTSLETINPETKIKIDECELNQKLKETFADSGLVDVEYFEHPEIIKNGFYEEEIMVEDYFLRLKKPFSSTLVLNSEYVLKNKKKSFGKKYSIDFKYNDVEEIDYMCPLDDCYIDINEID
jgi:Zn ribbon nucleic-acid-binding protein